GGAMRRLLARNFFASRRTNEKRVESTEGSSVNRAHCIAAINLCVRQPERWQTTRQPSKASEAGIPCSDDLPTGRGFASLVHISVTLERSIMCGKLTSTARPSTLYHQSSVLVILALILLHSLARAQ